MVDADFDTNATESPYFLITSELGVHSIQVLYNSQHFPNEQAMPVEVTVEGEGEDYHIECHGTALLKMWCFCNVPGEQYFHTVTMPWGVTHF